VRWLDWSLVAHDEASVTLTCAVRPQPRYEWQFDLQVIYALNPVGLVMTCRAVNVDSTEKLAREFTNALDADGPTVIVVPTKPQPAHLG